MYLFRLIMIYIFRQRYIILKTHDGEEKIRRVWWRNGKPYASYYPYRIRDCGILDNGKLSNGEYVISWEKYNPFTFKKKVFSKGT